MGKGKRCIGLATFVTFGGALALANAASAQGNGSEALNQRLVDQEARIQKLEKADSLAFSFYGYARLDANYDTDRMNDSQLEFYARTTDPAAPAAFARPKDAKSLSLYPRLSRLGVNVSGPKLKSFGDAAVSGKVELDFYAFNTSDSRNELRMRHTYLNLDWKSEGSKVSLLAGQTSDLISPLFPSINYDTVMWGAANLGDRRPQLRLTYANDAVAEGSLSLAGMVGLTGAVDGQDLDANGFLDGETSGTPTFQARLGWSRKLWTDKAFAIGAWGHWAKEDVDAGVGASGAKSFDSEAWGIDVVLPLHFGEGMWFSAFGVQGEWYAGKNTSDVRGGILQGVNTVTGKEIESTGWWGEVSATVYKNVSDSSHFQNVAAIGYALDDPESGDLSAGVGARDKNAIVYFMDKFVFEKFSFGFEYHVWTTEYLDLTDGENNRFKLFLQYDF